MIGVSGVGLEGGVWTVIECFVRKAVTSLLVGADVEAVGDAVIEGNENFSVEISPFCLRFFFFSFLEEDGSAG